MPAGRVLWLLPPSVTSQSVYACDGVENKDSLRLSTVLSWVCCQAVALLCRVYSSVNWFIYSLKRSDALKSDACLLRLGD